jgi:hypothetical protein
MGLLPHHHTSKIHLPSLKKQMQRQITSYSKQEILGKQSKQKKSSLKSRTKHQKTRMDDMDLPPRIKSLKIMRSQTSPLFFNF